MNSTRLILAFALATCFASPSFAVDATAPTGSPCQDLEARIQAIKDKRIQELMPKESPTAFVNRSTDARGILSQDVTAGFSKLMSLDFGSLAVSLLNKGLDAASNSATAAFGNGMNAVLNKSGIASYFTASNLGLTGVAGQAAQSSTGAVAATVNSSLQTLQNQAANTVTSQVNSAVKSVSSAPSIYSNAPAR